MSNFPSIKLADKQIIAYGSSVSHLVRLRPPTHRRSLHSKPNAHKNANLKLHPPKHPQPRKAGRQRKGKIHHHQTSRKSKSLSRVRDGGHRSHFTGISHLPSRLSRKELPRRHLPHLGQPGLHVVIQSITSRLWLLPRPRLGGVRASR